MPTGIDGHTVSLTKNGYFKLRDLIVKYPSTQILGHLDEISLDWTQALKMLAGNEAAGTIPGVWDKVRRLPTPRRNALLLISIIFSHKDLISLFAASTDASNQGVIHRAALDPKTYTNLAYAMNELGLAVGFRQAASGTRYDWGPILALPIGSLVKEILQAQLESMGWTPPRREALFYRTFYEQAEIYRFHLVFGLTKEDFESWLEARPMTLAPIPARTWTFDTFFNSFGAA